MPNNEKDLYYLALTLCVEAVVEWFWWDSSLIFDDQLVSFSAF